MVNKSRQGGQDEGVKPMLVFTIRSIENNRHEGNGIENRSGKETRKPPFTAGRLLKC